MKFNRIQFPKTETSEVGLKEINVERLGNVVALIGKNGSGKTRILNFIENHFSEITTLNDFLKGNITEPPPALSKILSELHPYKNLIIKQNELEELYILQTKNPGDISLLKKYRSLRSEVKHLNRTLAAELNQRNPQDERPFTSDYLFDPLKKEAKSLIARLKSEYLKRVDYAQIRQLQESISERDDSMSSFEQLVEAVTDHLEYDEFGSIYKSGLGFLKKLPHQLSFDWIECLGDKEKFQKRVSYKRFKALKDVFDKIFGKTLEWETKMMSKNITSEGVQSSFSGVWKIDNREFNYSEFSPGEKTLFAYVLIFFLMSQNSNIRLKDSIILIDEPELHLHADSEIDLLNGIRSIIGEKGQLWIATHSINILSHLSLDEVFMVKEGEIKHPSKTIQREALSELMRIEERVDKLSEFLTSISDWTFVHFMTECFLNPQVIEIAHKNDSQIKSLVEILDIPNATRKIRLLDFGAGKGRFYEQASSDQNFNEMVKYSALEPDEDFRSILTSKGIENLYSNYGDLDQEKFDFIVLCNVLHEIEIDLWVPILNKLISCLGDQGNLIIIEAKKLSKGEKIGAIGYLLLDEFEIQKLFALANRPATLIHKTEFKNISCVLLPAKDLKPVSESDIMNAMRTLEINTLAKIEKIRNNADMSNHSISGRESAFLSQLHINSRLAQMHLNKKAGERPHHSVTTM